MAYVSHFDHDVFVSYAQVDDQSDADRGWVSMLVHKLTNRLAQLLGRRERLSVFMDHQLRRHTDITPELKGKVQNSAVLLSVHSQGYLASAWCQQELDAFASAWQGRGRPNLPLFIVERDRDLARPTAFDDKLGYRFWTMDADGDVRILGEPLPLPDERDYYKVLDRLARELAEELNSYGPQEPVPEPAESVTVYVADVTDDLDSEWNDVKTALKQRNDLCVLPAVAYPRDPDAFRVAVANDLKNADLCVQLLSTVVGRKLEGTDHTTVSYQAIQAAEFDIPLLQWRHPNLSYSSVENSVSDDRHRQLLLSAYACDLSEFVSEVLKQAKKRRPVPSPSEGPGGAFVFVDVAEDDDPLAEELCDFLAAQGYDVVKPIKGAKADEFRQAFEANFLDCDAVIVVHGAAQGAWVQGQLIAARKLTYKREKPLIAMALYEGPPPKSVGDLGLWLQNLQVIPCYDGLDPTRIQPFVETIEQGIRHARDSQDPTERIPQASTGRPQIA